MVSGSSEKMPQDVREVLCACSLHAVCAVLFRPSICHCLLCASTCLLTDATIPLFREGICVGGGAAGAARAAVCRGLRQATGDTASLPPGHVVVNKQLKQGAPGSSPRTAL